MKKSPKTAENILTQLHIIESKGNTNDYKKFLDSILFKKPSSIYSLNNIKLRESPSLLPLKFLNISIIISISKSFNKIQ